jgi:tetratricopeptide (TPR) repeat protein
VSYRAGLPHLAYFRALAREENEEGSSWRGTLAGLAAMRLLDVWSVGDALPDAGVRAVERAIKMMDVDAPERESLERLEDTFRSEGRRLGGNSESQVLAHVRAYADVLSQSAAWTLAIDVCRTIIREARTPSERAMLPLVYDRLGRCLRACGKPHAAMEAFQTGRARACAVGDIAGDLHLRISEAVLEAQRGHKLAAELILDEVTVEAAHAGLPEVCARAMHDRGTIAYRRGEPLRALSLYFHALDDYGDAAAGDRVFADIALVLEDIGHRDLARQVLLALETRSIEQSQRWAATVNLMRIAALDDDEALFTVYHRRLAQLRLSARQQAYYHLFAGEAWLRFGRPALARQALSRAQIAIARYQVRELVPRLSDCQREAAAALRGRPRPGTSDETSHLDHAATVDAPPELQPLIARTTATLTGWRSNRESLATR